MSADNCVIICILNAGCGEIESVVGQGTPPGSRTGVAAPPAGPTGADAHDPGFARAGAENFPVALRLLPASRRLHLMAVYRFARTTDDIGDQAAPGQRLALLHELEADVRRLYGQGDGASPKSQVVQALAPAVTGCAIPVQPFLDLIQANRQDQTVTRYVSFEELLGYCALSANPVGRIVLHVFGCFSDQRAELSDRVCSALQLAEHWQDVAEDLRAGRVYLPARDMDAFGVTDSDLGQPAASPQVRALIAFETRRARELLDSGAPLVGTLRGTARAAVAGYVAGGRAALAAISAAGHDVLRATPLPRKPRIAAELALAYARGR
jgi:squalene synthase HpnC